MALDDIALLTVPTGPVPPVFVVDPLVKGDAMPDLLYSDSISDDASDANGDALVFTKISGPDWLSISPEGALSGTPGSSDIGLNSFGVDVSDGALTDSTTLTIEVLDNTVPLLLVSSDFETDLGGWTNVTSGDTNNWTRDSAGTPSSSTGPTTGAGGSAYYVYLETSSGHAYTAGNTAILESPGLPTPNGIKMEFQYHMYGANMGTLALDVFADGIWHQDVWSISGQQQASNSAEYASANVDLTAYTVSRVRFRATAAGGYWGDMAIDNVELRYDPQVPVAPAFNSDPVVTADALQNNPYGENIAADASDANGDPLTFAKTSGPVWLSVQPNGDLIGTPAADDVGTNSFVVEVSDGSLTASATLNILVVGIGCVATPGYCDDGNTCNGQETCELATGNCLPGTPLICDDGSACTTDSCDAATGCEYTPVSCDDVNECTNDSCDSVLGCQYSFPGAGDVCSGGMCDGQGSCVECLADSDCNNSDVCDGAESCVHNVCQTGTSLACDDGDACNGLESCDATSGCVDGITPICDDGNECTTESCDMAAGCVYTVLTGSNCGQSGNGVCNTDGQCMELNLCRPGYSAPGVVDGDVVVDDDNTAGDIAALENVWCVTGNVRIEYTSLGDLSDFNDLRKVAGSFEVSRNDSLTSLQGLNNLESLGRLMLMYNENLQNLTGLDSLAQGRNIEIFGNHTLVNLNGLERFTVLGRLVIVNT